MPHTQNSAGVWLQAAEDLNAVIQAGSLLPAFLGE